MYENAGGIELKDTTQTSADSLEDLPPGLAADVIAGIREIGLASASRQGPDVFRAFTRQVRRLLGADRVSVSIWDPSIAAARPVWRDVTDQEESHYLLIPVGHGQPGAPSPPASPWLRTTTAAGRTACRCTLPLEARPWRPCRSSSRTSSKASSRSPTRVG